MFAGRFFLALSCFVSACSAVMYLNYNGSQFDYYTNDNTAISLYQPDGSEYSRSEYANAPIYMDGVAVGVVYFFDTVAVRDNTAFVQEYATYFFDATNSSINYQYDFMSSTDSAQFDDGQVIQARMTGGSGNYVNNSDGGYVYVKVDGSMRYVTLNLPSSSSSSSSTLSNGSLVAWCAVLTTLMGVFMAYVLFALNNMRSAPLAGSSSSSDVQLNKV